MAKPSPFPGMDPYIEPVWGPFHVKYINRLQEQLTARLPDDLYAVVEADVYVVDRDVRGPRFQSDVGTFDRQPAGSAVTDPPRPAAVVAALAGAVRVSRPTVPQAHMAIREPRQHNRLVTAIGLFSPTNKGDARDRQAYRDKRDGYLIASANVVEIDLLRGGQDLMDLAAADLPPADGTTFRACVRFAIPGLADHAEFYPMPLRRPLSPVAVPLRSGDDDIVVDLQAAMDHVYAAGRFDLQLDYGRPPAPPLPPADAAWAAERVAAAEATPT